MGAGAVGRTVVLAALILASGPAPCFAQSNDPGMDDAAARQLTQNVLRSLGSAIGPTEVATFQDTSPDSSVRTATSPIRVIASDSRQTPVPGIYSNCQGDADSRTVRCDLRLLDDLIDGFALLYSEDQRGQYREALYRLVLAHELGHVVLHHHRSPYHGGPDGFSVLKYAQYKIELEADGFAVKLLDGSKTDLDLQYGAVVELANAAVRKSLCPDTFPAPCPCPGYTDAMLCSRFAAGPGLPLAGDEKFPIVLAGTHPEFIVRFARLLDLSTNTKAKEFYGNAARQVLLRVVVKDERGKTEPLSAAFR